MMYVIREVAVEPCPFCGARLEPHTSLSFDQKIIVHYFHPLPEYHLTEDRCLLSGKGYSVADLTKWNQRAASADTLPKGQDAQQGLAGTESGAVPEGQTPNPSPSPAAGR